MPVHSCAFQNAGEIRLLDARAMLTKILNSLFTMKYLAAYLLLALAGNEKPSAADIKSVLSSVGIDADEERVNKVISELEGKDLQEVSHA